MSGQPNYFYASPKNILKIQFLALKILNNMISHSRSNTLIDPIRLDRSKLMSKKHRDYHETNYTYKIYRS